MNLKAKKDALIYVIFFSLPIAICPKIVQLVIISLLVFVFFYKYGRTILSAKLNDPALILLAYIFIYSISILYNTPHNQLNRILASINTIGLWLLSLFVYIIYSNISLSFLKISRIALCNMIIMILMSLLYYLLPTINIHFLGRSFVGQDWIDGEGTRRLLCFFEYANLVSIFCLIFFPLSLLQLAACKRMIFVVLYLVFAMFPIAACASRSGVMLGACMAIIGFFYVLKKKQYRVSNRVIFLFVSLLLLMMYIFSKDYLFLEFDRIFSSRSGSNNTRFALYQFSLKKAFTESPLIGCGIKSTIPQFGANVPVGSHSTYIGVIYKTGILGFVTFSYFIFSTVKYIFTATNRDPYCLGFILIFLSCLFFEDADGANWLLPLIFGIAGCLSQGIQDVDLKYKASAI